MIHPSTPSFLKSQVLGTIKWDANLENMFCESSLACYLYVFLLSTQHVLSRNCEHFIFLLIEFPPTRHHYSFLLYENITLKDYVYTLFALFEYSVVYTNIAYHYKSGNIFGSSILIISSDQTYNLLPSWTVLRSLICSCHVLTFSKRSHSLRLFLHNSYSQGSEQNNLYYKEKTHNCF